MAEHIDTKNLHLATNVGEAEAVLRVKHFHGISIDQNVPLIAGSPPLADGGLSLALSNRWPLTKKVVYTGKGDIAHSHRIGLAGIEFRQKSAASGDNGNRRTLREYCAEFVGDLHSNYIEKALTKAGELLPHSLAVPALKAAEAKAAEEWSEFFRAFVQLRENLLKLTLCVAFAAQKKQPPWKASPTAYDVENALKENWDRLGFVFDRYLSNPNESSRQRLFDAASSLRKLRNSTHHYEQVACVKDDYDKQVGSLLVIVDLLAFFCEHPIICDIHFHSRRRDLLTYKRMGPNKVLVSGTMSADPDPPESNKEVLYITWQENDRVEFLTLDPWVTATANPARETLFGMNLSRETEWL